MFIAISPNLRTIKVRGLLASDLADLVAEAEAAGVEEIRTDCDTEAVAAIQRRLRWLTLSQVI